MTLVRFSNVLNEFILESLKFGKQRINFCGDLPKMGTTNSCLRCALFNAILQLQNQISKTFLKTLEYSCISYTYLQFCFYIGLTNFNNSLN